MVMHGPHGLILIGALCSICYSGARAITPSRALLYSLHHDEGWDMSSKQDEVGSSGHVILATLGSVDQHVPAAEGKRDEPLSVDEAWPAILMASLAGLSTVLGALVVFCLPAGGVPRSAMSFGLSLAAGVMITVSVMELWPEGVSDADSNIKSAWFRHLLLFGAGAVVTFLICKLASCLQGSKESDVESLEASAIERRSWRLAILLFISLTAHNLPEGLAVAISAMADQRLGLTVMLAIAVHNIPEGVAVAIPTLDATKSKCMAISVALLSGMTETLGAVVAILVLQPYLTANVIEELLIFVAGIMCYIAFFELLPESVRGGGMLYVVACIGLAVGAAIMILTHLLLEQAMHDDHDHDGHDHDHHHHHH